MYPAEDESITAKTSESVTISCKATGYPLVKTSNLLCGSKLKFPFQPIVTWKKNDVEIQTNETNLTIDNVQTSDAGVFICTATNLVGFSEKVYYLSVTEVPKILNQFSNLTLKGNQSETLDCASTGSPAPKIMWRFNNQIINKSSILKVNSSFQSGTYECVSINSEGSDVKSLHVEILREPTLIRNFDQIEKSVEIKEKDELELICPFENFIDIHWIVGNGTKEISDLKEIDNRLVVSNVNSKIHGSIECLVTNLAGNKSFIYNISVLHAPKILSNFDLSNSVNEYLTNNADVDIQEIAYKVGETLILNCSAAGNPPPKVISGLTESLKISKIKINILDLLEERGKRHSPIKYSTNCKFRASSSGSLFVLCRK